MKIDKKSLADCIKRSFENNMGDWDAIADDLISECLKSEPLSVSDISLSIATVMHFYGKEDVPTESIKKCIAWIDRRIKNIGDINLNRHPNEIEVELIIPEIMAKAQWIESAIEMNKKGMV